MCLLQPASGTHLVLVLRYWHCSSTPHTIIKASARGFYFSGLGFFYFPFAQGHFHMLLLSRIALGMTVTLQGELPCLLTCLAASLGLVCSLAASVKIFPAVPSRIACSFQECTRCHLHFTSPWPISVHLLQLLTKQQTHKQCSLGKKVINSNKIAHCRSEIYNVYVI